MVTGEARKSARVREREQEVRQVGLEQASWASLGRTRREWRERKEVG